MTAVKEITIFQEAMEVINEYGLEGLPRCIEIMVNEAMKIERSRALSASPYERSNDRKGYANGFKPKTVKSRIGNLKFSIPQVRGEVDFYPSALERGVRSEKALKIAVAEMYVQGVSTRKVTKIVEELCGLSITSAEVSRASALLDEELEKWRSRPLGRIRYLILDASYEKVRIGGRVVSAAVLVAVGVKEDGRRSVLGVSTDVSEAEVHWRNFLRSLQKRGMHGVECITADEHVGLGNAIGAVFPGVVKQRCQCHLQRNAMKYVPRVNMRKAVAADIRATFNAPNEKEALRLLDMFIEKYRKKAPKLADWAETALPEGLQIFQMPEHVRKRLRTTNGMERLNKEINRRTRVAGLFPNTDALLRLVSAVLIEISDEWETGNVYLKPWVD